MSNEKPPMTAEEIEAVRAKFEAHFYAGMAPRRDKEGRYPSELDNKLWEGYLAAHESTHTVVSKADAERLARVDEVMREMRRVRTDVAQMGADWMIGPDRLIEWADRLSGKE